MIQIRREPLHCGIYFCLWDLSFLNLQSLRCAQYRTDGMGVADPAVLTVYLDHFLAMRAHTGRSGVGLLNSPESLSVTEI